ncbi:MAG: SDR family NAD(P)-dependent oxidoreductase, partial [Pseudonocardiaceae bacterium]|nr:SDR family NAD(P)-dependent oxidoreductase [Pseudonocardiaceae bacterium]
MFDGVDAAHEALGAVKVLPEAAQLEMIRAAALLSETGTGHVVRLTEVTWHEVVVVDRGRQVHAHMRPADDEGNEWIVYSDGGETGSTGYVTILAGTESERLDLDIWRRCSFGSDRAGLIELGDHVATADSGADSVLLPAQLTDCLATLSEHSGWDQRDIRFLHADEVTFTTATSREATLAAVRLDLDMAGDVASLDIDLLNHEGMSLVRFRGLRITAPEATNDPIEGSVVDSGVGVVAGRGRRVEMVGWSVGECVLWELCDVVSVVLKLPVERLDVGASFQDLGFDSIRLVEFAGVLGERFGVELTPDVFFSYPTLDGLSGYLLEEYAETVGAFYREGTGVVSGRGGVRERSRRVSARRWGGSVGVADGGVEPVAVVGMSGRFPGAWSVDEFWSVLSEGRCTVGEVPVGRGVEWRGVDRWLGAIPGVAEFDPLFFEVSPREAEVMDPRQRLLLQEMWRALEDAGYGPGRLAEGKVGIFVGAEEGDYRYSVGRDGSITSNNTSVLAARLAYFLDLSGPSMSINTSCSSGLVALHEACLSLRFGDCDTAIVAGANILSDPGSYDAMAEAGMLSPDGVCYAFDQRANGMVPGEAVVALVLKRERVAAQEGCRVYGSVLGSGVNYDGKTNGITAPSGAAQRQLLGDVYQRSGVAAESVGYVVAHGTGTRLGDPVEINALVDAFGAATDRVGYCALTSTKPNVGHTQAASGLVSVIALVQAMRHEVIPPSIHCDQLSDYVRWDGSPFFVNREPLPWPEDSSRPRRGGVSSFGFSGTNAHVILQAGTTVETEQHTVARQPTQPAYLLPLSAKNQNALARLMTELAYFLERQDDTGVLTSVSYILMTARHHFSHRCALVVHGHDDAARQLRLAADGQSAPNIHSGVVARDFTPNGLMQEVASNALGARQNTDRWQELLEALAGLYCQGYEPTFHDLFDGTPVHISFPSYPFARDEYWIAPAADPGNATSPARLHPLVHENTSNLTEQAYTSVFTDAEPFVVAWTDGNTILSPSAHLEMAHEAVRRATAVTRADEHIVRLQDLHWYHPITACDGGTPVRTALIPERTGAIGFEITSGDEAAATIHSRGYALLVDQPEPAAIDLPALRDSCARTVGDVHVGTDVLVADLSESKCDSSSGLIVDPRIIDAALRATTAFWDEHGQLHVPTSLERAEIFNPCKEPAVSVVRRRAADKYDIDICDESGRISLRVTGLVVDLPSQEPAGSTITPVLEAVWSESALPAEAGVDTGPGRTHWPERHVLFCDSDAAVAPSTFGDNVRVHGLIGSGADIAARYSTLAEQLFEQVRQTLQSKPKHDVLLQVVVAGDELDLYRGLGGLLRTARLENPKITAQLIDTDSPAGSADTIARIEAEAQAGRAAPAHVRYTDGRRFLLTWRPLPERAASTPPWQPDGTYLITGGTGGLGLIFAREIAERMPGARVVLTGRSAPNERIDAAVESVRRRGARAEYVQLDVTDLDAVTEAVGDIAATGGSLRGVLHCAGVLRDGYIVRKGAREVREVLAPKVTGLVNLDRATAETPLDFIACFASSAGSIGNAGQSDYALGNAFMDGFAVHRNAQVMAGIRHGRTIAVDWGLWQDGGMAMDEHAVVRMEQQSGIVPIPRRTGIDAFYRSLASDGAQTLCLSFSDERRFQQTLTERLAALPDAAGTGTVAGADTSLMNVPSADEVRPQLVEYLTNAMAIVLKLPVDWIDAYASFDQYGLDSISVVRLTEHLEHAFGTLPKTLFFEYQSLAELSEYFLEAYSAAVARLFACDDGDRGDASHPPPSTGLPRDSAYVAASPKVRRDGRARFLSEAVVPGNDSVKPADIAIIGLAGRYPEAADLDAFWANLLQGRDSVTEIPLERWDYRAYYHDDGASEDGRISCRWGGFLDEVDRFDSMFFNISPRDAEVMDPQERLFLECTYATLQDAGYTPGDLDAGNGVNGQAGVFVGATTADYQLFGLESQIAGTPLAISGNFASIANRVSFHFNFHGPSLAVDTMCSSSLTAMSLACDSLRLGNCDVAIAGGVNLSLHPNKYLLISQGKFASDKGRCAAFGDGGDGYVPSEGVGAVLLKPLEQAERDGDHIYGVIKGTAVNHGGSTNGFTVPSPNAQGSVISRAVERSGVDQRAIGYIEAHGTGTSLGDPIEVRGLCQAFDQPTDSGSCAIGSVKSNIGHAEAAAGIAGLTKILLQMRHGKLVPSLHSEVLNPYIDLAGTPFVVQQEVTEWSRPVLDSGGHSYEHPRVAALSSFGAGGSNGHLIVQEYRTSDGTTLDDVSRTAFGEVAIVLSAKTEEQLDQSAERLLAALRGGRYTEDDLPKIAYTLQLGREAMPHRMGFLSTDLDQTVERLSAYLNGTAADGDILVGCTRSANAQPASQLDDVDDGIGSRLAEGSLKALLGSWVRGGGVDWHSLYADTSNAPGRISLPTYPFADETYWLPIITDNGAPAPSAPARLHPLVHENTSDLGGLRFTSTFDDPATVPSPVGQLEMARAALLLSSPDTAGAILPVRLRDVAWYAVPEKKADRTMYVALAPEAEDEVEWSIYADRHPEFASDSATGDIVFSAGTAAVLTLPATEPVDVASMRTQCAEPAEAVAGVLTDGHGRMLIDLNTREDGQRAEDHPGLAQLRAMDTSLDAARVCLQSIPETARVLAADEVVLALSEQRAEWAVAHTRDLAGEGVLLSLDLCTEDGTVVARARDIRFDSAAEADAQEGSVVDSGVGVVAGRGRRVEMVGWSVGECVLWELCDVVSV